MLARLAATAALTIWLAEGALRPPAVPLIVHEPYVSVWLPSDLATESMPIHWAGATIGMVGMIRIDNTTFRWLGVDTFSSQAAAPVPAATQLGLPIVTALQTAYAFSAGGVILNVTFSTPALLNDPATWNQFPVTYVSFTVASSDVASHSVAIYFEHTGELMVNNVAQDVIWSRNSPFVVEGVEVLRIGSAVQNVLGAKGDDMRTSWGYQYLFLPSTERTGLPPGVTVEVTATNWRASSLAFVNGSALPPVDPSAPRPCSDEWPVLAAAWRLGTVPASGVPVSVWAGVTYDAVLSMNYFGADLAPVWTQGGRRTIETLVTEAASRAVSLITQCKAFGDVSTAMYTQAAFGDTRYAELASLAFRQVTGSMVAVTPPANGAPACAPHAATDVWYFMEEMSSDGDISTVDVIYPASPLLLLYSPLVLWRTLLPIFDYAANCTGQVKWNYNLAWAPHDLGTWPIADKTAAQQEQMPLEEVGNMLVMTAAVANATGNVDFILPYQWSLLRTWASFANASLPMPPSQLATDDFAGPAPNNTNLVVKGINGMAAFAALLDMANQTAEGDAYRAWARSHVAFLLKNAAEGSAANGTLHFRRQYPLNGTWSLKYNMLYHYLLDLRMFPPDFMRVELAYYGAVKSQPYGIPLDDRYEFGLVEYMGALLGMSAMDADTVKWTPVLLTQLYNFANATMPRLPMTDWYRVDNAKQWGFQARATVGDLFALALLRRGMPLSK